MISIKGAHFPIGIILYTVFFASGGISYPDFEAIMEE
jgi:hypothetical protein